MKGSPTVSGGPLTGKPTWPNTSPVFGHVGFFYCRRRQAGGEVGPGPARPGPRGFSERRSCGRPGADAPVPSRTKGSPMFRLWRDSVRPSRGSPNRRRVRPAVDALEGRLVPAVFNPSPSVTDNNPNSLRDAVIEANSNGGDNTINLAAGSYLLTLQNGPGGQDNSASSGDLDLTTAGHTYIIQGAGPNDTFIDATHIDRVFQVL